MSTRSAKPPRPTTDASPARLSIGALSRATGVPAETLRTWERRYGYPKPAERTHSGHRLYAISTVEAIRMAIRAMDRGHKPSQVLGVDRTIAPELSVVGSVPRPEGIDRVVDPTGDRVIDDWLRQTSAFDSEALLEGFSRQWDLLGAVRFLDQRASPFLRSVGTAWAERSLDVAHEHFASEHLREFLSVRWRPLSERASAGVAVCATPTGEKHVLGLHMAATVLSSSGFGVVFLGADVPVHDAANAARASHASAIALSASSAYGKERSEAYARRLLGLLDGIPLLLGGGGYSRSVCGARWLSDCRSLEAWARQREMQLA